MGRAALDFRGVVNTGGRRGGGRLRVAMPSGVSRGLRRPIVVVVPLSGGTSGVPIIVEDNGLVRTTVGEPVSVVAVVVVAVAAGRTSLC